MLSTLALGFGFATTALAHETAMAPLKNLAIDIEEDMKMSDAFEPGLPPSGLISVNDDRRRIMSMGLDMMERYLGQRICGNTSGAIKEMLQIVATQLFNMGSDNTDLDNCDVLKSVILPHLRSCAFGSLSQDYTLYAGFTYDAALIGKYARAVGSFIDNRGNEGCFDTHCWGGGAFAGKTVGAVAGVLFGDGLGDFPGVAYGGEFGATITMGADIGGGFTYPSGIPYVEVAVNTGISGGGGLMRCSTTTEEESQGSFWGRRMDGAEEMEPLPRMEEEDEMEE